MDLNIKQKIVTDNKNTFFTANKFMTGSSIPTEGEYVKGDIIVNIGENAAEEPMWICVEAGSPGVWQLVGIANNEEDDQSTIVERVISLKSKVVVIEEVPEVAIGIDGFDKESDTLLVFINSVFATEGVEYEISSDSLKIVPVDGNWNKELMDDFEFDFVVFKNVRETDEAISPGSEIVCLKSHKIVNEPVSEVEIGIEKFNKTSDALTVYRNSVYMIEGVDYEINGDNTKIVSLNGNWNSTGSTCIFAFEVMKTVAKVNPNAIIGVEHITDELKEAIAKEAIGDVDLSDYASKNEVNAKLAELESRVEEAFTSANNGKELIASAIGEPLSAEDTFSAMSNDINTMTVNFRNALAAKGVNAPNEKFEVLISKIEQIVQDNVVNNQVVKSGSYTVTADTSSTFSATIDPGFTPEYFILHIPKISTLSTVSGVANPYRSGIDKLTLTTTDTVYQSKKFNVNNGMSYNGAKYTLTYSSTKFTVTIASNTDAGSFIPSGTVLQWYAIGTSQLANNGGAVTITPSTSNQVLSSGYYSGNITVTGDTDLIPGNIVSGKNIFGVTGTAPSATVSAGSNRILYSVNGSYSTYVSCATHVDLASLYATFSGSIRVAVNLITDPAKKPLYAVVYRNNNAVFTSEQMNKTANKGNTTVDITGIEIGDIIKLEYRSSTNSGGDTVNITGIQFMIN